MELCLGHGRKSMSVFYSSGGMWYCSMNGPSPPPPTDEYKFLHIYARGLGLAFMRHILILIAGGQVALLILKVRCKRRYLHIFRCNPPAFKTKYNANLNEKKYSIVFHN